MNNKYKLMGRGGINNEGFKSLSPEVQAKIRRGMGYGGTSKYTGGGAIMDMLKAKSMEMGGMAPQSEGSNQEALIKLAQSMSKEDAMMMKQILDQMLGADQGAGGMM